MLAPIVARRKLRARLHQSDCQAAPSRAPRARLAFADIHDGRKPQANLSQLAPVQLRQHWICIPRSEPFWLPDRTRRPFLGQVRAAEQAGAGVTESKPAQGWIFAERRRVAEIHGAAESRPLQETINGRTLGYPEDVARKAATQLLKEAIVQARGPRSYIVGDLIYAAGHG